MEVPNEVIEINLDEEIGPHNTFSSKALYNEEREKLIILL